MSATATTRDRPLSFHWKPIDPTWIDGLSLPAFRSKKQAEAFISILTEAIVVGRGEPDRWISYSRRAAFYSGQGRYHGTAYTFATVPPAIDELAALNLLEHDRRPPGSIGRQSRFRASPELMSTLDKPLPVIFDPLEVVRLKDAEGRLVEYRDTAATERMRHNLETINEALRTERIDLEAPGVVTENDIIRCGDQKLHKQLQLLWRVFNRGRFTLGGRSYGGWWQTVRRIDRSYISLDGEPTVEHDYEQLHPRLLYAIAEERLSGDAYTIDGWERPLAKRAFNILINADTQSEAVRALGNEIGGVGAHKKAAELIDVLKIRHAPIAAYFHSGIGLKLQRMDADIAESVMLQLLSYGIVALPIHDSFIGRTRHGDQIKAVMDDALFSAFPSLKTTAYTENVPHMARVGPLVYLILPVPDQGDLFPVEVSVPVADLEWRRGVVPQSLRSAVRHEMDRRALNQSELACEIGISRPQLTNALQGRYGLGPAAAERLKNFIVEARS